MRSGTPGGCRAANAFWMYYLSQAFGWSALLWAWLTTMFGLVRSSTRPSWSLPARFSAARVERWHRTTSLTTIGLMFAHAFLFFAELVRANDYGRCCCWPACWPRPARPSGSAGRRARWPWAAGWRPCSRWPRPSSCSSWSRCVRCGRWAHAGAESAPLNVERWMLWAGTAVLLVAIAGALLLVRRRVRT